MCGWAFGDCESGSSYEGCADEVQALDDCLENASENGTDDGSNHENVAACEQWLADTGACAEYYGLSLDCSSYLFAGCDVSEYFYCLSDYTYCDESTDPPTLDATGWDLCTDLAICE
jgi:hypothetical protein